MKSDKLISIFESIAMLVANVYVLISLIGYLLYDLGIGKAPDAESIMDFVMAISFISIVRFSRMEKRIKDLEN